MSRKSIEHQGHTHQGHSHASEDESWWVEGAKTVGLSLLLAFGIRTFVAEARYIPSGSMEPTLEINDRLIIDKISYRFQQPQRGDIVVFSPPQALRERGFKDDFIKRIVGLPGERIEIRAGGVYINNQLLTELYVANGDATSVETCAAPGSAVQPFLAEPQTIPTDHYLVLGDNRYNSLDGRCWGLVGKTHLVGRAAFRFWPFNRVGTIPDAETTAEN